MTALVRALQRNRANRMCIHREIYFKELAHVLMEAGESSTFRIVWTLETHTRVNVVIRVQRPWLAEVLPAHRRSVFVLVRCLLCCYNKMPQMRWLKRQIFISYSSRG